MAKFKKYKKQPSSIPSIISMALVLFLLTLLALVVFNANKLSNALKESYSIRVFLLDSSTMEDAVKLQMSLDEQPYYKEVKFVHKDEAAKEMIKEQGHDFIETLGFNPIAHSIELVLKSEYANEGKLKEIIKELEKRNEVFEVHYQEGLLESLNKNLRMIELLLLGLCLVFAIVAAGLINSTIRLNLYSRRFIIKSMQLVGATEWFIIRPLISKFMGYAVIAGILAAGLVGLTLYGLVSIFPEMASFNNMPLFVLIFCVTLTFGIGIVAMSTYFSTKKYLKIKLDGLY